MTWRRGEAGSTLIDRPKDAPVPDFTNGKERVKVAYFHRWIECLAIEFCASCKIHIISNYSQVVLTHFPIIHNYAFLQFTLEIAEINTHHIFHTPWYMYRIYLPIFFKRPYNYGKSSVNASLK